MSGTRYLCQFSCGAASAVATKLAIAKYNQVVIVNAFVAEEHQDNRRFLADCERWFDLPVVVLRDEKYGASTKEVFKRTRYMKGPHGAPCTMRLKRAVLDQYKEPGDILVFGFTIEEQDRFESFVERNPEVQAVAPLIDAGLGKADCLAMVERAGIKLPEMYRLGYRNANCIGCVKGGEGYFRAIREDFPIEFEELCAIQDDIGAGAYLFRNRKTGERYSLRDIPKGKAVRNGDLPECSFFCMTAEKDYTA